MVEILVTTGNDVVNPNDGVTSLREALGIANTDPNPDADTIRFGPSISNVTLDANITWGGTPLTIVGDRNGDGISEVTISQSAAAFAGPIVPIFVMDTGTLRLETLRFADIWVDGRAGPGAFPDGRDASVILNGGNLTLDRVVFEQVTVIGGPGAQGMTGGSGIPGNDGPRGQSGGNGTRAADGGTGGAGGTASVIINADGGVLTLDQVGLAETVSILGGAGGQGGLGGNGGAGGAGGDSPDIFSDAGDGGNGGPAGNGGQGGRGGRAFAIDTQGVLPGGTGLADGSTKTPGLAGGGGIQGAGGLPGPGGDAEFGSDGRDGLFGNVGVGGPAGDPGFAGTGAVSTPVAPTLVFYQPVDVDVSEGENIVFRFNRIGDTRGDIDVAYTIGLGGAGFEPDDIFGAETGTARLGAGSLTSAVSFLAVDDPTVEDLETFILFINSTLYGPLQGPGIMTTLFSGPGSIAASDTAVSLSPIRLFAQEGEDIEFGLQRTGVAQDFTVSYRLSPEGGLDLDDFEPGTAFEGTVDFTAAGPDFVSVALRTRADGVPEGTETFGVEITGVTGGGTGPDSVTPFTAPAGGQLSDREPEVVIDLVPVSPLVTEGESIVFDITRTGATFDVIDVPWTLLPDAGLDASDFAAGTSLSGSVRFTDGGPNSIRITLPTRDDTEIEPTETFAVSLGQITDTGIGGSLIVPGTSQFFGEIGDDDVALDRLSIAALQADRPEGDTGTTPVTFSVTRSGDLAGTVTVDYQTSGAANAADFAGGVLPGGSLTLGPNVASRTLTVQVSGDTVVEPDEAFSVRLVNPGGAIIETGTATGTIRNDDTVDPVGPTVTIDAVGAAIAVEEGAPISFSVVRAGSSAGAFSVAYSLVPGAGFGAGDLPAGTALSGTVAFTANGPDSRTVSIPTLDDALAEGQEPFEIRLGTITKTVPSNEVLTLGTASLSGRIEASDQTGPTVTVNAVAGQTVVDEGSPISFGVTRTGEGTGNFTVAYEIAPGAGFTSADLAPGTALTGLVEFVNGGPNTRTVSFGTIDDALAEEAEPFTIMLGALTKTSPSDEVLVLGTAELAGRINASDPVTSGPPDAVDDSASGAQFTPIFSLDVTGNDANAEAIVELSGLSAGNSARTLGGRVFNNGDGTLDYAPRRGFAGEDSFDYVLRGTDGTTDRATVEIDVAPISEDLVTARLIGYLYEAGLGRTAGVSGLNFFANRVLVDGATERQLARGFLNSEEFAARAGGAPETLSDRVLVEQLFLNVLGRPGAPNGIEGFVDDLQTPGFTREALLITFAESPENLLGSPSIATIEELPDGTFDFV